MTDIERISPINVIPEGCLCFMEETGYIIEAVSNDFDAFVEFCEMQDAIDESGEVVNEAEDSKLKVIKDKALTLLTKFWQMIKDAFGKVVKWFKEAVSKAKEALDKVIASAAEKGAKAADKAVDVKAILNMKDAKAKIAKIGNWESPDAGINYGVASIKRACDQISTLTVANKTHVDDEDVYNRIVLDLINHTFELKITDASDLSSAIEKNITEMAKTAKAEPVDENSLQKRVNEWIDIIFRDKQAKDLKSNYNSIKKAIATARTMANRDIRETPKGETKPNYTAYLGALVKYLAIIKKADGATADLLRTRFRSALKMYGRVLRLSLMAKTVAKGKEVNESAAAPEVSNVVENVNFALSDLF